MEHLLQRPLPGELWSSTLLRSSRRAGLPIATILRALTGRKWSPSFFHYGYVPHLAPLMRLDSHRVLWEHTVFGYATAFYEVDLLRKTLAAVDATDHAATGSGSVVQSVSGYVRFRRFCAACARSDLKRWGESYWHVAHNLPGVLMCAVHQRPLFETALATTGSRSWSYALPHETAGAPVIKRSLSCFERELTHKSVQHIGVSSSPIGSARSPEWYRRELQGRGWVLPGRAVCGQALVQWFSATIGPNATVLGLTPKEVDLKWVMLMIRPRVDIPFVPLKHLMLETALAVGQASVPLFLTHRPSGLSKRPTDELDRQYAASVQALAAGYREQRQSIRLSDLLTEVGCWSKFRHGRTRFPLLSAAIRMLRNRVGT